MKSISQYRKESEEFAAYLAGQEKDKTWKGYRKARLMSKTITCAIVICLLLIDSTVANCISVVVWFFAPKILRYAIESILHLQHKHDIV